MGREEIEENGLTLRQPLLPNTIRPNHDQSPLSLYPLLHLPFLLILVVLGLPQPTGHSSACFRRRRLVREVTASNDGVGELGDGGDDDGLWREAVLRVEVGGVEVDLGFEGKRKSQRELRKGSQREKRTQTNLVESSFLDSWMEDHLR